MKVKTILLTLLVCLSAMFVMAACFDNTGSTGDEPSVHKHAYIAVEETPSTCIKAGTKSHYKCNECGKLFVKDGDEYVERTEADLALPLAAHSFNGITVKTNPTKTIYTAFEAFDPTGIKVVKTCSVAGCEGEEAEDRDVTFAYEKENADKLTADMTKVVIKAAGFETEFAVTVNKIVVELPVIESKEYTGGIQYADVPENKLYTVSENNGGTDIGEYNVKLALTDPVNYAFEGVEGAEATVKFEITKIANEITMPASIEAIGCHGEPTIEATAQENASITYVYATSEEGEYGAIPEGGFVAGTYYVKAVAAETASYKETVSDPMSFEVKHALKSWNSESEDVDTGVCACGAGLDETFDKKVTVARQDIILSAGTNALTLGGVSSYKSVKNIKYGELNLGNNIAALAIPEGMDAAPHGEQELIVVVIDNYGLDHTIKVPVTIVTQSITTLKELKAVVSVKERDLGKRCEGKYYILANDIEVDSYAFNMSDDPVEGAITWDNEGNGFAGTLDGRNHSLIGGEMYGGGMFSSIESGTLKNIKFEDVQVVGTNRTLIAGTLFNATLENVEIYITDKKTVSDGGYYFGILASHPVNNVTLKNVKIDATGSTLPYVIGYHSGHDNADPERYHCTDVEIIADSIDCFTSGSNGKLYLDQINGVSFKLNGSINVAEKIDPKEFEYLYEFEEPWTRYTELKSVQVNDNDITEFAKILENMLVFEDLTNCITEDMFNKTLPFIVEFNVKEESSVKVTLNISILDNNEQKTLETNQDVILKDARGERTTFTLNLGDDLQDCTITRVVLGEEKLTFSDDGTITISEAMKNGTHGVNTLTVFATKDNTNYNITVPITIVTESISTFDRLKKLVGIQTNTEADDIEKGKGKYYILASNITVDGQYSAGAGGSNSTYSGFAGTLDGRNNRLIGGTAGGHGLFGGLYGGTIKNITFDGVTYSDNRYNSVIANNIFGATMENVTIIVANEIDMSGTDVNLSEDKWNNRGLIAFGHTQNLKMTKVTIEAKKAKLFTLFGTGSLSCQEGQYTCSEVTVTVKGLKYLGRTKDASLGIDEVEGLTVTIIAEEEIKTNNGQESLSPLSEIQKGDKSYEEKQI